MRRGGRREDGNGWGPDEDNGWMVGEKKKQGRGVGCEVSLTF